MSIIDEPEPRTCLSPTTPALAIVGVQCCRREIATQSGNHPAHAVVKKYVDAVVEGAGGLPLLVPAEGDAKAAEAVISRIDGLLVPGSPSNVEPHHYSGRPSAPNTLHDPARDAIILPLLRAAIRADLPILAICRGIQELNVALGGTLHQRLQELPGRLQHFSGHLPTIDERYSHRAHSVELTQGGLLAALAGRTSLAVNSLHHQGIDRLAPSLRVEGIAPDGQIEAVSAPEASFVLGVQWHPEFRFSEDPISTRLFAAFGAACRARAAARSPGR